MSKPLKDRKVICKECGWQGRGSGLIRSYNPWKTIFLCPNCTRINRTFIVCDEEGCWEPGTSDTQTSDGHRFTCMAHIPTIRSTDA